MPRKRLRKAFVLAGIIFALGGCYESRFPLGPPGDAGIDAGLLGSWRCVQGGEKESKPFLMTVMPFDEKQYYVGMETEGEKAAHYRAYSSMLRGTALLNLQELDPKTVPAERRWLFVRPTLLKPSILQVELAKDEAFKGVLSSASAVREHVEKKISDPGLFQDFCICTAVAEKR